MLQPARGRSMEKVPLTTANYITLARILLIPPDGVFCDLQRFLAMLALVKAVDRFDVSRGVEFTKRRSKSDAGQHTAATPKVAS